MLPLLLIAGVIAGIAPPQPRATGIIDGLVSDTALVPLNQVTVSIMGTTIAVVTSENGRFRFVDVPAGRYQILARRVGSEPVLMQVEIAPGETLRPAVTLVPVVTTLAGVRVTGSRASSRLVDFERRRLAGEGQFLTAAEMEKRPAVAVEDYLQRMKGIRIQNGSALNRRFVITQPCAMNFYVDNIPRGTSIDDLPSPKEIAGIEVYLGPASMPVQFKRPTGVSCGIIMIWTKDDSTP
jgi:hypothetical protein